MLRKEHHGDLAEKKDRNLKDPLVTGHWAALWNSLAGGSELISQGSIGQNRDQQWDPRKWPVSVDGELSTCWDLESPWKPVPGLVCSALYRGLARPARARLPTLEMAKQLPRCVH